MLDKVHLGNLPFHLTFRLGQGWRHGPALRATIKDVLMFSVFSVLWK